ncbi:Inner membrane amino-acid ABC transporter permease protein YhdY [Fundidesulfovibrio magnetotacticus]|uniref:Inner membrane amino-acid ABC transporter permease protein YhdY n=1 Tax=Fundidesulfovibrio magnetotacticus TaxID=2730080 RepID=A0A6V8M064_9BACT|nr:amino acid ABC transporter permease [Fundidesulfovibrio magnetotacticus]GFK93865.1 Inner membrane amino-acid ABC transporter permease protein YhdY [Fundidesulfovibrio magnetotacticus]
MAPEIPDRPPPRLETGAFGWVRRNLLWPWYNAVLTALSLLLAWSAAKPFWNWAVANATLTLDPAVARQHTGAAWGYIRDTWPIFMTGIYPAEERWRPLAALVLVLALAGLSLLPRLRRGRALRLAWLASPLAVFALIHGGGFTGLPAVETHYWGGLMLTVLLSVVAMAAAFPLSVLLALGRTSELPVARPFCVAYIEVVRGVPLITILFMASVVLPLFLPSDVKLDKVMRAMVGITLFFAAYLAENIRGGLQGIPKGQYEAADALGMGYWKKMTVVILPQALRIVIPPMVNNFIAILKDTSLVGIVGLMDLLQIAFATTSSPKWFGRLEEANVFIAFWYWVLCYGMSSYSARLERKIPSADR